MDVLPRYVRVNRLKTSAASLKARLQAALQAQLESSRNGKLELAEVQEDPLVPDLLVLHAEARSFLQKLPEVATGEAVLQDRSSCLAALAAGLTPGTFCLDACAAPGSKTCHAVEVLGRGRLIACERDAQRAGALLRRLKGLASFREGATAPAESTCLAAGQKVRGRCGKVRVELRVKDFLETRPWLKPWSQVEVLLVDPSCSGSGLPEHGFDAKPHGQDTYGNRARSRSRETRSRGSGGWRPSSSGSCATPCSSRRLAQWCTLPAPCTAWRTRTWWSRCCRRVPGLRGEGGAAVVAQRFALGGGEGQKALAQLGEVLPALGPRAPPLPRLLPLPPGPAGGRCARCFRAGAAAAGSAAGAGGSGAGEGQEEALEGKGRACRVQV
ncbi:unnamed protein product [Effrenium voratum]|nr:unnamed protein product [Effrenium voratum]